MASIWRVDGKLAGSVQFQSTTATVKSSSSDSSTIFVTGVVDLQLSTDSSTIYGDVLFVVNYLRDR
jgi:hypothetical protein